MDNNSPIKKEGTFDPHLSQVIKVVLMVDPFVVRLQTIRLIGDVFDIRAETVEKFTFKKLQNKEKTKSFDAIGLFMPDRNISHWVSV